MPALPGATLAVGRRPVVSPAMTTRVFGFPRALARRLRFGAALASLPPEPTKNPTGARRIHFVECVAASANTTQPFDWRNTTCSLAHDPSQWSIPSRA